MGAKFSQIKPLTEELAALEHLKNPHRLILEKCCDFSSFFFFIFEYELADKKDNYKSLDEFEFHQESITYYMELATLEHLKID